MLLCFSLSSTVCEPTACQNTLCLLNTRMEDNIYRTTDMTDIFPVCTFGFVKLTPLSASLAV